jgi:HEAT repeat protein
MRRDANLTSAEIARLQRVSTGASKVEREKAIERLGAAQDPATVALLTNALHDQDPIIVDAAVRALGRIGATSSLNEIEQLVASNNSHVRQGAVWSLGQIQDRSALRTLLKASTDTSKHIRDEATWALGLLGDAGATDRLNELAQDRDWHVRLSAACALWLSEKPNEGSRRTLAALKSDAVPLVRSVATWVVEQLP